VSPQYEQLTGYTPEQRLMDPELWVRMLHPDDRDAVLEASLRSNESTEPWDIEYRIIAADGRTVWLHDHAVQVRDRSGATRWQGILQDVTEAKASTDAIARRDAILEATSFAAESFLRSPSWQEHLHEALTHLGTAGQASRCAVFQNHEPPAGGLGVTLVDAWLAEGCTIPTEDEFDWAAGGFDRWVEAMRSGRAIHGSVDGFPARERDHLERASIRSLVAIPIFVEDAWWGYIGFDHVDEERRWLEVEVDALTLTARTIGAAIERELATTRLEDAQARYRTLVEQIPALTYIEAADTHVETYVSPQIESLLGYTPEGWRGRWRTAIHPDDRKRVWALDDETNRTGEPFHAEYRLMAKDGRTVWVRDDAILIRDADGEPTHWQGVRFDITAEKEAEQHLREAEERYRAIVEHVPAAIYLDRPDGTMQSVYMSPQIADIAGVGAEEWIANPQLWLELVEPEVRDALERSYVEAVEAGRSWSAEYRIRTRDGRAVWLHDETTFVRDAEGNALFLQGVIFDVTERRLAEQALRESEQREREAAERLRALDEMKNTFLAAVSHELRSPLTSILGLALTLERAGDIDDSDRADLLVRLAANAKKLDRLLKDLLDIDRLNRGIVEPQYRATDVSALARRTVENMDSLAGRDVVVRTDPVVIPVDPPKVERIVENLLMNAARHTTNDRKIWLTVVSHEGGVRISVEDDGPGVPEELRSDIFKPFRQGPTPSPHAPGTGIGLSLVSRFAELHRGRAWVEEREGGGAAFHVVIPGTVPSHGDPAGTAEEVSEADAG
jgi:PAS domain S-box-containing protein